MKYNIKQLIENHQQELYWYIRKILISHENTKDVLQETFLRAWKSLDGFRGQATIQTWLYRIARNEAIRFLEKEKRRLETTGISIEVELLNKLTTGEYISGDDIEMNLQRAILTLPLTQREVFNMRYFDEMKYELIAEILETSVNSAKVSYHHAKTKIEQNLKEEIIL